MAAHGYPQKRHNGTTALAHRVIAEKVLGKKLPAGAEVHHWDGNRKNNDHANLVICPSNEYHVLMHSRQAALAACGDANKRRCTICKQWDDPANLKQYKNCAPWHAECSRRARKQWGLKHGN